MALAKAFPDTYMYELHEPTSVSVSLDGSSELSPAFIVVNSLHLLWFSFLRTQVSVTRDQPLCHHLQLCPATPPPTTARQRTTMMTNATMRIWRQKRTGWTSASPTPCRSKTSLLLHMGSMEIAMLSRARKTESRRYTHTVHIKPQ